MPVQEKIYSHAPLWFQNTLISLKGLEFETKRVNKKSTLKHYIFLLESQNWSKDQILEYQNQMLSIILKEAFLNVPYYQKLSAELKCDYRDFKTVEDIQILPFLEKKQIRGNELQFVNQKIPSNKLLFGFTSGTTGTPLKLFYSQNTFSHRWAFELRLRNWAGLQEVYHPRRVQFTGRDIIPLNNKSSVFWRYNLPAKTLHCSTSNIDTNTAALYAEAISAFKPDFVDGYPSSISTLSKICLTRNYSLPKVTAIRVSAETFFEEDRKIIEEAFKAKVFNQYGSSESSCFCSENEFGEMLVHPEFGLFEVIKQKDGEKALESIGEVVTTSFMNPVMPLIRYKIGDIVKTGNGVSTPYGKNFIRLDSVLGRTDDVLYIPGRGFIGRLDPVFKGAAGILESQIILENSGLLRVNIVPDNNYSKLDEEKFIRKLRQKVGNEIKIEIVLQHNIPRGPNGKFPAVIDHTKKTVNV